MNSGTKGRRRCLGTALAVLPVLCGLVANSIEAAGAEVGPQLSPTVYSDPKGYFRIRPPGGWLINEYSADPRGKVDFNSSSGSVKAQLKVIAQASPFAGFDEMLADSNATAERFRARYGATITVSEVSKFGTRAVEMITEIPGKLRQKAYSVLLAKNYYVFFIGAPPELFDANLELASKSLETFEPILKDLTAADAKAHQVASKIRTAELYLSIGRKDWALIAAEEGLQLDANNQKLRALKERCEK